MSLRPMRLRDTLCVSFQRMNRRNTSIANLNCRDWCCSRLLGRTGSPTQVERPCASSKPCTKQQCFLHLTSESPTSAFLAPILLLHCRQHTEREDGSVL